MTSDYELKAGKFTDGLAHALQAIRLNDRDGGYYVVAAANAYWDQGLRLARDYCDQRAQKGPQVLWSARACQDAQLLFTDLMFKKQYTALLEPRSEERAMANGALRDSHAQERVALPDRHL